ncbi:unnamed protein product [Brachionus calyciflorus]|uniref:DUF4476 domain-containing protein n=1 Tax=Brachionus calyciflorus TaxID=104777 RepID=A0A813R6H9_9BILA|nr:unnamed protein product [Brachionus calyciflorus]
MPIEWIAKNPRPNIPNEANQVPMGDSNFGDLMNMIIHNRDNFEDKLELLLQAKGFFSGEQASQIVSTFSRPKDKIKAVMILEPKLVSMTCQQASHILAAISIPEDKLNALEYVKRAINDANTQEGQDYIVNSFSFSEHKLIAAKILKSVVAQKGIQVAAGGHLGYAPMGCLYTNAVPNHPHIYGPVLEQVKSLPNHRPEYDDTYSSRAYVPTKSSIYDSNSTEKKNYLLDTNTKLYQGHSDYLGPNKLKTTGF